METGDKPSCTQDPLIRSLWSFYQQIKFRWLPWSCSVFSFSVKGLCLLSILKHLFPASMNTSNKKKQLRIGEKKHFCDSKVYLKMRVQKQVSGDCLKSAAFSNAKDAVG